MKKAEYDGTVRKDGEDTKMLTFTYSDIGGSPRSIQARTQKEADEIAQKLLEDIKSQEATRKETDEATK